MDSVDKHLAEMSKEFESRSKAKVVFETGLYTLVLLSLLIGNSLTVFIISFNRQMRTVPMLVASLATTDFLLGLISATPLGISTLAASRWPFGDTTCQYQGYMAVTLALTSTQLSIRYQLSYQLDQLFIIKLSIRSKTLRLNFKQLFTLSFVFYFLWAKWT